MKKPLFSALLLLFSTSLWAAGFTALDQAAARRLGDGRNHAGPTIVTLWSSDCIHCKKNLRLFASLIKADKRLRLISVAVEPESPELGRLLDTMAVPGKRYAYGDEAPEALAYGLDAAWRGELPRTLIFDGKGGRTAVSGVVDEAAVRRALALIDPPARR